MTKRLLLEYIFLVWLEIDCRSSVLDEFVIVDSTGAWRPMLMRIWTGVQGCIPRLDALSGVLVS
jgi:hypothetical protein